MTSLKRKLAADDSILCQILSKSLQQHGDSIETDNESIIDTLEQSSDIIQRLGSEALENTEQTRENPKLINGETVDSTLEAALTEESNCDEKDLSSCLRTLSNQSLTTCRNLHLLVYELNNRSKSKKTCGNAWRTLQSLIDRCLDMKNKNVDRGAIAFAILSLGITLSHMDADTTNIKMITSAIIPNSPLFEREPSGKFSEQERLVARHCIIRLLNLALDYSIDLQTVVKIESTFAVGSEYDRELGIAVANVVRDVFGNGCCSSEPNNEEDELGSEGRIINKDKASPTLALVAQCQPFQFINAEKLIRVAAADLDLWYSAELVVDASIASVTSSNLGNGKMATCYPKFEPSESLSTQAIDPSLGKDTIAHLNAKSLIDIALDLRLYRRADLFATKYYKFGGPERFAEARFLHACDTITKVVKRRQPQIIDKQVQRIDECVLKVGKDLDLSSSIIGQHKVGIGEVPIESMPHYIREFSLRRLRSSNMSAAAFRLAQLWDMNWEEDPVLLAEEQKKRQLTYVQWNDEGSPGNFNGKSQPLPDLISNTADLTREFILLVQSGDTIGFDAEWGETNGVAVLQLSTTSHSILLDIPALGSNDEYEAHQRFQMV